MTAPFGEQLPDVRTALPGSVGAAWIERLANAECPAFTTRRARREEATGAPHDPIVWTEALGSNVRDADGNVFVDLTGGFGAAAVGHRHPDVVRAIREQSDKLLHALGDLHPSDIKIALLERLCALGPWPEARAALALSGSDAVTAALKTAAVHTKRPGVLAFEGGYHGLGYGPLAGCGYSESFRAPFAAQLNRHVVFASWPDADTDTDGSRAAADIAERLAARGDIGAVLVEPIQGRGGVRLPPPGFLRALGEVARAAGAVVIADEILTGLGRTGVTLRSVADGLVPDLLCLGKALGGGLPVSACVGDARIMAAWGAPDGAAIHTGTFFGGPLGCAASMAALDVLERDGLGERAARAGTRITARLREALPAGVHLRGQGLLIAADVGAPDMTLGLVRRLLEAGYLALPAGSGPTLAVQIAPPLNIHDRQLDGFVETLSDLWPG